MSTATIDVDAPLEDMTAAELRTRIARDVGALTNPMTALDKGTLNSIYAYLTGEFYIPKSALDRYDSVRWKSRSEVLRAVLVEAGLDDIYARGPDYDPDYLRVEELRRLAAIIHNRTDQRDWVR